ncbi:protein PAXX [Mixophyes fleayi]|uniref:protein PAXX n=1 Tax=Mixophyes fleayi TaxID=3061075 RepID=UPI003F4E291B
MEDAGGWSPLCTLSQAGQRFLCLYQLEAGSRGRIHITNGSEVWRTDPIEEALEEWDAVRGLTSQELVGKLRETFQKRVPVLEMQGSLASLSVPVDSGNVTLDLLKLPVSEARTHVQEVLFDFTDRMRALENLLKAAEASGAASGSPGKPSQRNHLVLIPDVDARRKGFGGSGSQVKKRVPGESLINPGCKSKKAAKGVAFEES